jgi:hypothetical protein
MPFRIENLSALARGIDRLARLADGQTKLIGRAVSTLKRRLPAQAKRDIGAQYNLPSRQIGSRLRCSGDSTSVTLTGLGRAQTLIKFGAKQNAAGVAVQVEKGKTLQIQHAFIRVPAGAPSAGPQVLIRNAEFGSIPDAKVQDIAIVDHNRHGYPIVLLGGPSIADMLRDPGREDRLSDFVQTTFTAEVDRLAEVARNGR